MSPTQECRFQPADPVYACAGLQRLDYVSGVDGHADWALALPPTRGTTWVVCIHGHGSHGDQLFTRPDIRDRWLPAFRGRGLGILTPNLRDNAWMGPSAVQDMSALVVLLRREFGAEKLLFTSGSMGGTSNLVYASLCPENVDGIIARGAASDLASYHAWCREHQTKVLVLGDIADAMEASFGGTPAQQSVLYRRHSALANASRLTMPVFLAHGSADHVIPVSQSRRLVGAMADAPDLAYVEVPGGNHDSPLHLQTEPDALEWVLNRW